MAWAKGHSNHEYVFSRFVSFHVTLYAKSLDSYGNTYPYSSIGATNRNDNVAATGTTRL